MLAPVHFHNHSFNISSVEYSFNCNFLGTVNALKKCNSAAAYCGNAKTTCCASANNYFRTAAGAVVARDNFPADGYCMDTASTGNISIARYSNPSTTGLDADGVVEAKCIETPKFEGVDTLLFFSTESIEFNPVIEYSESTFLHPITAHGEEMYFYDETKKGKHYEPIQMHYHAPSEHTIDGKLYDLELHIVHKNDAGDMLSVIGIFFDMEKGGNKTNFFLE